MKLPTLATVCGFIFLVSGVAACSGADLAGSSKHASASPASDTPAASTPSGAPQTNPATDANGEQTNTADRALDTATDADAVGHTADETEPGCALPQAEAQALTTAAAKEPRSNTLGLTAWGAAAGTSIVLQNVATEKCSWRAALDTDATIKTVVVYNDGAGQSYIEPFATLVPGVNDALCSTVVASAAAALHLQQTAAVIKVPTPVITATATATTPPSLTCDTLVRDATGKVTNL